MLTGDTMILDRRILLIVFWLFMPGWSGAASVPGDMQKRGQGEAYYLGFIKVYDASLYSSDPAEAGDVLSGDVSKCLYLEYAVDIEREDFVKAANSVLNRQFSDQQLAQVDQYIELLHQGYRDVQDGDSYTLCYTSTDKVTTLSYNDILLVSVDAPHFAKVYFSIWLGQNEPLDESLRDDLLAGFITK